MALTEPHSPYAAVGATLVGNGYSAIPIAPGEKHPGRFVSYGWQPMGGWSKFCGELPPAFHVASWSKWPNAGVGIALGRGLESLLQYRRRDLHSLSAQSWI